MPRLRSSSSGNSAGFDCHQAMRRPEAAARVARGLASAGGAGGVKVGGADGEGSGLEEVVMALGGVGVEAHGLVGAEGVAGGGHLSPEGAGSLGLIGKLGVRLEAAGV